MSAYNLEQRFGVLDIDESNRIREFREKAKGDGIYNYLLHKFENMKLTDKTFDRKDFNLQEYTNQSFGKEHLLEKLLHHMSDQRSWNAIFFLC